MKRLRKSQGEPGGSTKGGLRFYMCGEYGAKLDRPHYHAAIFGEDFSGDRYEWKRTASGVLYRSPRLEKLWDFGYSSVAELNFDTAAYIARYIMKKITGDQAAEHYKRIDPETGETYWLPPEFSVMSRGNHDGRGGIGADWFRKYRSDVYPHDTCIMNGAKFKPPRYYDKLLEKVDAAAMEIIKEQRENGINHNDNTPARLKAKEAVAQAKLRQSKRNL